MLVEKEVIGPATHWYRDEQTGLPRKLVVTPTETKYWAEQGNKMLGMGLTVPIPCEHDFDAHPMTAADKLKNNAGWVKEYHIGTPNKDGTRLPDNKLFAVCDIQDEEMVRKLPKTIRWTSPWISSFTDGAGRDWKNVISHLALTTRPRIIDQAPFGSIAAALSMATPVKLSDAANAGFCLSRAGELTKQNDKLVPRFPMAFSLMGGVALGEFPPMAKKKAPPKGPPKDTDGDGDVDMGDAPPDDPTTAQDDIANAGEDGVDLEGDPDFGDNVNDVSMEEILADLLAALDIHVEPGSGEQEFKRSLYNAAMSKIHDLTGKARGDDPKQQQGMGNQPPNGQRNQTPPNPLIQQEQQPMYMSLQEINQLPEGPVRHVALSMYNENVKLRGKLDANEKATASLRDAKLKEENAKRQSRVGYLSRVSPRVKADLDAMLALPAMALSMGEGGTVVDPMAQTLAILEKGLGDMPRLLTSDMASLSVQPQPTDAEMSSEQSDELADSMARRMGCAPIAKAG